MFITHALIFILLSLFVTGSPTPAKSPPHDPSPDHVLDSNQQTKKPISAVTRYEQMMASRPLNHVGTVPPSIYNDLTPSDMQNEFRAMPPPPPSPPPPRPPPRKSPQQPKRIRHVPPSIYNNLTPTDMQNEFRAMSPPPRKQSKRVRYVPPSNHDRPIFENMQHAFMASPEHNHGPPIFEHMQHDFSVKPQPPKRVKDGAVSGHDHPRFEDMQHKFDTKKSEEPPKSLERHHDNIDVSGPKKTSDIPPSKDSVPQKPNIMSITNLLIPHNRSPGNPPSDLLPNEGQKHNADSAHRVPSDPPSSKSKSSGPL